jgi:methyltransferase
VSGPLAAVIAFSAALAVQRVFELRISQRHAQALRARGAVEYGRRHFPMFVILHTLLPLAMILEVAQLGARPGPLWPMWAGLFLLAQALRYSAIKALGPFWNVRVLVVPGAALVHTGPYRFLRHPNYVAVVIELVAAPMIFVAWRTAILVTLLNALALSVRIRCEERALGR